MPNLQIPYAFTNTKLPVSPQMAKKGQPFSCPVCEDEVILRRGDIRQPHFAHKPDTGCSGEGVLHKTAKEMIHFMYKHRTVSLIQKCPNTCGREGAYIETGDRFDVDIEVAIGKYKVDVVRLREGKPYFGIEVRNTHPVPDEKWDAFQKMKFPCIEVEAQSVVRMWEWDLGIWKKYISNLQFPQDLPLRNVRHNLYLFNDWMPRLIYCPECDKDTGD